MVVSRCVCNCNILFSQASFCAVQGTRHQAKSRPWAVVQICSLRVIFSQALFCMHKKQDKLQNRGGVFVRRIGVQDAMFFI